MSYIQFQPEQLHVIAGGGLTPDIAGILQNGALTLHLMTMFQLRQLDSPAGENAYQTFADASLADRPAFNQTLTWPMLTPFLEATQLGEEEVSPHRTVEYKEYMGNIAAAAALRTGVATAGELTVRVHGSSIYLPGLGRALLEQNSETAAANVQDDGTLRLRTKNQEIVIEDPTLPAPSWQEMRYMTAGEGDTSIRVALDDLDPYRLHSFGFSVPDERQSEDRYTSHLQTFRAAWELVANARPEYAKGVAVLLRSIVPAGYAPSTQSRSMVGNAFGTIGCTAPLDPRRLAAHLANGTQKNAIIQLNSIVRLFTDKPSEALGYTPSRDVPVPPHLIAYDCFPSAGLAAHFRDLYTSGVHPEKHLVDALGFARWHRETSEMAQGLLEREDTLTPHGRRLFDSMLRQLDARQPEVRALPRAVKNLAEQAALDHAISWRLQHLRVSGRALRMLHRLWATGQDCPDISIPARMSVAEDATRYQLHGRRERYVMLEDTLGAAASELPASELNDSKQAANRLWANGNLQEARTIYRAAIQHDPSDKEAWAGFALTYANDTHPARTALLERPHVVADLYATLNDSTLASEAVAAWLRSSKDHIRARNI